MRFYKQMKWLESAEGNKKKGIRRETGKQLTDVKKEVEEEAGGRGKEDGGKRGRKFYGKQMYRQ